MGSTTAAALLPMLLAVVRVWKEGQSSARIASAIDEGYRRVARRQEVIGDWGRATDIRLVRFGRGKVRDEWRHLACWVQRGGGGGGGAGDMSIGRFRESVGMERCAMRRGSY